MRDWESRCEICSPLCSLDHYLFQIIYSFWTGKTVCVRRMQAMKPTPGCPPSDLGFDWLLYADVEPEWRALDLMSFVHSCLESGCRSYILPNSSLKNTAEVVNLYSWWHSALLIAPGMDSRVLGVVIRPQVRLDLEVQGRPCNNIFSWIGYLTVLSLSYFGARIMPEARSNMDLSRKCLP